MDFIPKIIYNKIEFEKLLHKKLDKFHVSYESSNKHGDWIDSDYSTVFDCFIETFEEISGCKFIDNQDLLKEMN